MILCNACKFCFLRYKKMPSSAWTMFLIFCFIMECVNMGLRNFCYCADCKCSHLCFYSNRRVKIDFTPLDFIIIDISCVIANCEYLEETMPAPVAWSHYEPTPRFEYLFSKYLNQVMHYLEILKSCLQVVEITSVFKEFLRDFLLDKIKDFVEPGADDVRKIIDDILLLMSV